MDYPYATAPGYAPDVVWDGLGLIPFYVAVHYQSDHTESRRMDKVIAFYEANAMNYRPLRDGEVLIMHGADIEHVA